MLSSSDAMSSIIKLQENCMQYITELSKIDNNTVTITESCANYKDILKAYQSYLKTLNLAWSIDASIQTLLDVQSVQKTFIKAIRREDVSDVNTKIKKNKDKSLEGITRILKE